LNVDVIVAGGGSVSPRIASRVTGTIPIVFPVAADPVGTGLVKSLARPGGNVTGLALLESEMNAKRVQLVRELLPKVERVAVIADPSMGAYADGVRASQEAARTLGLKVQVLSPRNPDEVESAFKSAKDGGAEAVVVLASSPFSRQSRRLVGFAAKYRLVTVWEHRAYTDAGGLVSYGHDIADMYRSAARYVDRILKGAKPAELPVEQGTKLDLVINLKTAKEFGITIPPALLVRADQLIQ
jgi:putative ABC transport system substrate-binding protein